MSLISASFLQAEKLDQCDEFRLPPDAFLADSISWPIRYEQLAARACSMTGFTQGLQAPIVIWQGGEKSR